jgi:hypothetical protein
MIQNDKIHAACSSTAETIAADAKCIGHQMGLMAEMLKQLRDAKWLGDAGLAKTAASMRGMLDDLDAIHAPTDDELMFGTSDAVAATRESAALELAAINRGLVAHVSSLAIARKRVRRVQARG